MTKPVFPRQAAALLICFLAATLFAIAFWETTVRAAEDLQIWVGQKQSKVDSRENEGSVLCDLRDVVEILNLRFEESDTQATVSGPRGRLQLTDNRPLVRFRDEYILLDRPVWRRKEKEWYISEDFLQKALPLILSQRLERQGELSYRVFPLEQNRVRVEVSNFPDHVRLTFVQSQNAPVRIQELQDSIRVTFDDYLVVPALPSTRPDERIVKGLRFDSSEIYGGFVIEKGRNYYNLREYASDSPDRRVIDLYAPPTTAQTAPQPAGPIPSGPIPPPGLSSSSTPLPVFKPREFRNVIALDPGHGGDDYGVHPRHDLLEKNYTLSIAERVAEHLRSTPYRAIMTRTLDSDVGVHQRSAIANYYQSRCYISIHLGGAPTEDARGPVVYVQAYGPTEDTAQDSGQVYGNEPSTAGVGRMLNPRNLVPWEYAQKTFTSQSKQLGAIIQDELNAVYRTENQVVEVPLGQLAPVSAPAVLVEAGFLTNPEDSAQLATKEFQDRIAMALVKASQRFLN